MEAGRFINTRTFIEVGASGGASTASLLSDVLYFWGAPVLCL